MKSFVKRIIVRVLVFTMLASNTLSFFSVNDVNTFANGVSSEVYTTEGETPESKVSVDEIKDGSEESKALAEDTKEALEATVNEDDETKESDENESSQALDAEKKDDKTNTASDSEIEEKVDSESSEEDGTEDVPEEVGEDESSEKDGEEKGEVFGPMTKEQMEEYKNKQKLLKQEGEIEDSETEDENIEEEIDKNHGAHDNVIDPDRDKKFDKDGTEITDDTVASDSETAEEIADEDSKDLDAEDKEEASPSDADILGALNFDNLTTEVIEASLSEAVDTPLFEASTAIYWYTKDIDGDGTKEELHLAGLKPTDPDFIDDGKHENYSSGYFEYPSRKEFTKVVIDNEIMPTDCESYFSEFNNLATISNIEYLNTSNVTNMAKMFSCCQNLTSLDVSSFDISNVMYMRNMFIHMENLTSLVIGSWSNASKLSDIRGIFEDCGRLESLDLSDFNVDNVETYGDMLDEDKSLKYIKISASFASIISACKLPGEWVSASDPNGTVYTSKTMPKGVAGEYYKVGFVPADLMDDGPKEGRIYWYLKDMDGNGTKEELHLAGIKPTDPDFIDDGAHENYNGKIFYDDSASRKAFVKLVIDNEIILPENSKNFFYGFINLATISEIRNMNTSNVTSMETMFGDCRKLTSLDLSSFDTSKVTNMYGMFVDCRTLTSIDVSGFDTSNVTDMTGMFSTCWKLTSLDVTNFDTSKVETMQTMFADCNKLTSLDLSNFDASKVTNFDRTLLNCKALNHIKISESFSNIISGTSLPGEWVSASDPNGTVYTAGTIPKGVAGEYYKVGFVPDSGTEYTVTFNAMGGTIDKATVSVAKGGNLLFDDIKATKKGYDFVGWGLNADPFDDKVETSLKDVQKDTVVFAKWKIVDAELGKTYHVVTFNAMGGETNVSTVSVAHGKDLSFDGIIAKKSGSEFLGWGLNVDPEDDKVETSLKDVQKDIVVFAKWKVVDADLEKTYPIVTFIATDGEVSVKSISVERGKDLSFAGITAKRTHLAFWNWSLDSDEHAATEHPIKGLTNVQNDTDVYALFDSAIYWYRVDNDGDGIGEVLHLAGKEPTNPNYVEGQVGWNGSTFEDEVKHDVSEKFEFTEIVIDDEIFFPPSSGGLFEYYKNVATISNMRNINTSLAIDLRCLFWFCDSLRSLDLSSFDTTNLKKLRRFDLMFWGTGLAGLEVDLSSFTINPKGVGSCMFFNSHIKRMKISASLADELNVDYENTGCLDGYWRSVSSGKIYYYKDIPAGVADEYVRFEGCTVELHTAPGTIDPSLSSIWAQTNSGVYSGRFDEGSKVELPGASSLKYEGHTFAGWFTEEEGKGTNVGLSIDNINEDKTIYAYWVEDTTKVSEYANILLHTEGAELSSSMNEWTLVDKETYIRIVKKENDIVLPGENFLTYSGHTFGGWYTEKEGKGSSVGLDLVVKDINENKDYYAYWIDETSMDGFIVTLFTLGGKLDKTSTDGWTNVAVGKYLHKYKNGEKATLPEGKDVKYDKYIFRKWVKEDDTDAPAVINTTSSYYAEWKKDPLSGSTITIKYNANGATWVDSSTKKEVEFTGDTVTLYTREKLTLYNKHFDGWSLTDDKKDIITEISKNNVEEWIDYLSSDDKLTVNAIFSDYSTESDGNSELVSSDVDAKFEIIEKNYGNKIYDGSIKVDLYKTKDLDSYYYVRMHGENKNAKVIDFLKAKLNSPMGQGMSLEILGYEEKRLSYYVDLSDLDKYISLGEDTELVSYLQTANKLITNISVDETTCVLGKGHKLTVYSNVKKGESTYPSVATMSIIVADGMPMTELPYNATRDGYTFVGFNSDKDNKGIAYTNKSIATPDIKELYMIWEADEYDVTYDSLSVPYGGTEIPAIIPVDTLDCPKTFKVKFDQPIPKLASASCIDPYKFDGWSVKDDHGVKTKVNEGDKWTFKGDASKEFLLTPIDRFDGLLVNIYDNEKTEIPTFTMSCNTDEAKDSGFVTALTDFVKVDEDGTYKVKSEEELNELGSSEESAENSLVGSLLQKYKNFTAQAKNNVSESMSYTITLVVGKEGYINNDSSWVKATEDTYTRKCIYGNGLYLPTVSRNDGIEFEGWYENPDYTGDEVITVESDETSSKTYYAKWHNQVVEEEKTEWIITLNLNGGALGDEAMEWASTDVDNVYECSIEVNQNTESLEFTLPKLNPPAGKSLIGWIVDGTENVGYDTTTINIKGNTRIQPEWGNDWTVNLSVDGEVLNDDTWTKIEGGYTKTFSASLKQVELPSLDKWNKTGYVFHNYCEYVGGGLYANLYYADRYNNLTPDDRNLSRPTTVNEVTIIVFFDAIKYKINFVDKDNNIIKTVDKVYGEPLKMENIAGAIAADGRVSFYTNLDINEKYEGNDIAENEGDEVSVYCVFEDESFDTIYCKLDKETLYYSHNKLPDYISLEEYQNQLYTEIKKIIVRDKITAIKTNYLKLFSYYEKLESIEGIENVDISNLTYLSSMFNSCKNLKSIDLSSWDTSKIEYMISMFRTCESLTTITGIENWDVSNVTSMSNMFDGCKQLTGIDFKNWDTSKVGNITNMFRSCDKLDTSTFPN